MAVPTGSGTEVIKAAHFDDVDATQTLIFGAQHHIYTVLSTICFCVSVGAASDIADTGDATANLIVAALLDDVA